MDGKLLNFIQSHSPDGGFLQSVYWQKFQESVGRKTFLLEEKDENGDTFIYAYVIVHKLPVAGKYFYVPRGPIFEKVQNTNAQNTKQSTKHKAQSFLGGLIDLAKKNNIGWIRIEPNSDEELDLIKNNLPKGMKMKKSAVDVQPREILMVDVSKSDEELLARMKQKTRYNVKLAEKRGVKVSGIKYNVSSIKYFNEFIRLVGVTSKRDQIKPHPESYYRKMFEIFPSDILKLYVAEFEGKIIAANLILFFGKTATYMHGASDNEHRNVMAPYLLQWRQIQDAKAAGCERYDFGGVKTEKISNLKSQISNSWSGITKFKAGFAPEANSIKFPGCWDIVLDSRKYSFYKFLQRAKKIFK